MSLSHFHLVCNKLAATILGGGVNMYSIFIDILR